MNNPIYIVSKGRSEYMHTSKYLTIMGVKHNIVVEPQDVEPYQVAIKNLNLLASVIELDLSYKDKYQLCDDLGATRSTGPGPARNFAWDHSIADGNKWHWVMDDNIRSFQRKSNSKRIKVIGRGIFDAMEHFCARYSNVIMAGPQYRAFAPARMKQPPFILNTRIYSCNLINNSAPYRWRGRYNEDTILSLDMLKGGWCTVQFNAFLQDKMKTQSLKGGNTTDFYHKEGRAISGEKYTDTGTLAKSQMQVKVHPDVSRLVHKFGRIHHHVDYSQFKKNKLKRRVDAEWVGSNNEFGMELKRVAR